MPLRTKRAYEPASPSDGKRYLVDGLWPRGVTKEKLAIDAWLKEIAPSHELRKWFGHDPSKYPEFRRRFLEELDPHGEILDRLAEEARAGTVTLVYGARDGMHCNAGVLQELLSKRLESR